MKQIPNLFTLLNLFFGCCSIVHLNEPWMASLFIGLAALVDFFDGFVARLLKAASELGKQLDSLADVVSFGVAPSLIIYRFLQQAYAGETGSLNLQWWWLSPAFLFACAAAYRLGKFNLDTGQQYHFKGIPSPMAGLLIASMPLIYWYSSNDAIRQVMQSAWFWYMVVVLVGFLMVCNWPMLSLKIKPGSTASRLPLVILLLVGILGVIFLQWLAVPLLFVCYIIVSLAFKKSMA